MWYKFPFCTYRRMLFKCFPNAKIVFLDKQFLHFAFSAPKNCKQGWKRIGNLCYQLGCTIPTVWSTAQSHCKRVGADLARINNADDMNAIIAWMKQIQPWTGNCK